MPDRQQEQLLNDAVTQAMNSYPWVKRLGVPIKLTVGTGPYESESYPPKDGDNPYPGNFTVQLRDPRIINNPKSWAPLLGREAIDYMARNDPTYQATAEHFRQSITPEQMAMMKQRYAKDQRSGDTDSFDDWLKNAETQEWIGGYVLGMPGWRDDTPYTADQRKMLDSLKSYIWQGQTPMPLNVQ